MDPNANLEEQVRVAEKFMRAWDESDGREFRAIDIDDATRLAELVLALDNWIRSGGFLPNDWSK